MLSVRVVLPYSSYSHETGDAFPLQIEEVKEVAICPAFAGYVGYVDRTSKESLDRTGLQCERKWMGSSRPLPLLVVSFPVFLFDSRARTARCSFLDRLSPEKNASTTYALCNALV